MITTQHKRLIAQYPLWLYNLSCFLLHFMTTLHTITSLFSTQDKKWCRTSNIYLEFLNSQATIEVEWFYTWWEHHNDIFSAQSWSVSPGFCCCCCFYISWWATCPQMVLHSNWVSEQEILQWFWKAHPFSVWWALASEFQSLISEKLQGN